MTKAQVVELQNFLLAMGADIGSTGADGILGPNTKAALQFWQGQVGVNQSGTVDPATATAIAAKGGVVTGLTEQVQKPAEGTPAETPVATPDNTITPNGMEGPFQQGIMQGGAVREVINNAGQGNYWIATYEYPPGSGHSFYYRFDSKEQMEEAIGTDFGAGRVKLDPPIKEADIGQWTDAGNASEIIGVNGTFIGYMNDTIDEAAQLAGLEDPTLLGQAMKDPAMQLILAKTAEGGLNAIQVKALTRETDFYKDVMYPGIENFYGQSKNPEELYQRYTANVANTAKKLGLPLGADGSYKGLMGQMLDAGVSDVAFAAFAPIYQKAQGNTAYADALSKWTQAYAGVNIENFEDWFDVLAGNAPAEIGQIAEIAGLQYLADNAGFNISDVELTTLSEATDLNEAQAVQVFSDTARALLSLGERGLRRGGLTAQQVLNSEAGFSEAGEDIEAIKAKVRKLAIEEGIVDDPTAKFFTDFNQEGAPIKAGLRSSIAEGA